MCVCVFFGKRKEIGEIVPEKITLPQGCLVDLRWHYPTTTTTTTTTTAMSPLVLG